MLVMSGVEWTGEGVLDCGGGLLIYVLESAAGAGTGTGTG